MGKNLLRKGRAKFKKAQQKFKDIRSERELKQGLKLAIREKELTDRAIIEKARTKRLQNVQKLESDIRRAKETRKRITARRTDDRLKRIEGAALFVPRQVSKAGALTSGVFSQLEISDPSRSVLGSGNMFRPSSMGLSIGSLTTQRRKPVRRKKKVKRKKSTKRK